MLLNVLHLPVRQYRIYFSKVLIKKGNISFLPNESVIFVDDDDLQLNFHGESREKAAYIYGLLQVHFVEHLMNEVKCKLELYMTLLAYHKFIL